METFFCNTEVQDGLVLIWGYSYACNALGFTEV